MTSVLASTLVISLLLTYATLKQQSRQATFDRLRGAASQLASLAQIGIAGARARVLGMSRDTAVVNAVAAVKAGAAVDAKTESSVLRVMAAGFTPADTNVAIELWTSDGRRVAAVARGTPPESVPPNGAPEVSPPTSWYEGLTPLAAKDSIGLGRFYSVGGRTYFWIVSDVRQNGRRIGYLLRQGRINSQPRAVETLRALMGSRVSAYYHNARGDGWTNLRATPVPPATVVRRMDDATVVRREGTEGELYAREDSIGGTPWRMSLELPVRGALEAPRAAILKILLISALLTLVGAAASWLISRRITRPIVSLTAAAESVAQGDFGTRVKTTSQDELGRLGDAFNRMAADVGASREDLAAQTAEAQATARELEHREAELRVVAAEAEKANRAKSEFLAVMSHELRTPLNAIAGYAELLLLEIRGPITDTQRRDLERIRASQQHLLGLISAVLDLSRIESGRVSYEVAPIALDAFLTALDSLVEPQAASKSLTLEYTPCTPSLGVLADREKLRQVMLNLLSNAIRFTPAGGRISVGACEVDDSQVAITVRDTGVGIAPEAQGRIFEPFVQLDRSLTQPREGIGLGLSISRDLARGMSGDITVESNTHGSVFTVTMPRATVEDDEQTTSGEVPVARSQAKSA